MVAALGGFLASCLAKKDEPPRRNEPYVTLPQASSQPSEPPAPPPTKVEDPPAPPPREPTITEVKTPTIPAEPKTEPKTEPKVDMVLVVVVDLARAFRAHFHR